MTKKAALKTAGITMEGYHSKPKVIDGQSPAAAGTGEERRTFTGIGLNTMGANVIHELAETKKRLAEFDGSVLTRPIDPTSIQRSQFANRIEEEFKTPEFRQLKDEIANAGGNVQAIKVRPVKGQDGLIDGQSPRYEIAFGHRRHQACLELALPVNAIIDENMSDLQLFEAMDRENRGRKNLSAWEQGRMYREALAKGLYPSERRLAESLGVNQSDVNRAVKLAKLPKDVVLAFSSPLDLQVRWQKPLTDALQRDPEGVLSRARAISKNRGALNPTQVLNKLVGRPEGAGVDIAILAAGKAVGTLRVGPKGRVVVEIESGALPVARQDGLAKLLGDFLSQQTPD